MRDLLSQEIEHEWRHPPADAVDRQNIDPELFAMAPRPMHMHLQRIDSRIIAAEGLHLVEQEIVAERSPARPVERQEQREFGFRHRRRPAIPDDRARCLVDKTVMRSQGRTAGSTMKLLSHAASLS